MKKVLFIKQKIKGYPGYDMRIRDENLSVRDLLEEMNEFVESGQIERVWPGNRTNCYACDLCCYEPLPVTSIDVENICQAKHITEFSEAFKYLWVEVCGEIVDITLRRTEGGRCIFLTAEKTCSIYRYRPFLCQTYVCCGTTENVEELRSQIVNQGMDELVRKSILTFQTRGLLLPVDRGREDGIDLADWSENCFTGKTDYSEILLQDVLSSDLLRILLL